MRRAPSAGARSLAGWFQARRPSAAAFRCGCGATPVRRSTGRGAGLRAPAEGPITTRRDRAALLRRRAPPSFASACGAQSSGDRAVTMLRFQLRADSGRPAARVTTSPVRGLLDPRDAARLPPTPLPVPGSKTKGKKPVAPPPPAPPLAANATLRVDNPTSARALVVVQGVPVAWLKPGAVAELGGFVPGRYRVGAARPFGQSAVAPSLMNIPGEITLGHPFARRLSSRRRCRPIRPKPRGRPRPEAARAA